MLGFKLGIPHHHMDHRDDHEGEFKGAVFPAGNSWIELWPASDRTPAGTTLQIIVDDADAWAEQARTNGLDPQGPRDVDGERIYSMVAPGGLPVTFQSQIE
jgi:hypothetical protein